MKSQRKGVIIIDKPAGLSSARVVATVKRIFQVAKAGHTGTLDPFATGVMVCPVNSATRLARFLLHGSKTYTGVLKLGMETDTQDSTGIVTARNVVPQLDRNELDAVFGQFRGAIEQAPPAYSALKHQGVPLYKLARQGRPVQKPPRAVSVFALSIQAVALPRVHFEVTCSGGTYVRTLCADIGAAIGCGGHLESLRRTRCGPFSLAQAVTLDQLAGHDRAGTLDRLIIAMADVLPDLPVLRADASLARKIAVGGALDELDAGDGWPSVTPGGHIKVVGPGDELLAVLEAQPGGRYRYCCVLNG
ncbi:MAG: tRNA pseudouridine(55) synthase TruB [Desulfobacterales bacterium]|nr:tRNA pseudouridine(55) synthase TruB [Desulfobacterales bacterium]